MKKILASILVLLLMFSLIPAGADDLFYGMRTYEAGQYRVGRDMVAGEYVLLASTSLSGYFCVSTDALGNDIVCNDLFEINFILTVRYGEYVELSRCIAIAADDFYSKYTIRPDNCGVMLKVGYDIQPGTYRLKAETGQTGYYCIYNDSRHDDIVDNDLFENSSYVTLRYGQYIILSRCCVAN